MVMTHTTMSTKTLIVIVGPTGSGKTALSLSVAKHYACPIISTDSRQFYRGIPIGTAQPDEEQLKRVEHHFIASHDLEQEFNCGAYECEALKKLDELYRQHDVVVAVGGSGLYTATIVPLAIMRRWILYLTTRRSIEPGDQTSVLSRLNRYQMMGYTVAMLAIHHTLFFATEALTLSRPFYLIATIVCSTLLSSAVAWPIIRIFTLKIVSK